MERTEKVHRFICQYVDEHDWPPTVREIGKGVGITSTSVVRYHLDRLVAAKKITRVPEISRGISVLEIAA